MRGQAEFGWDDDRDGNSAHKTTDTTARLCDAPPRARPGRRALVRTAGRPSWKVRKCARPAATSCASVTPPARSKHRRPIPLRVEGSFRNPVDNGAWEYSMVLTIRNERGEEIARKLVGVGAMKPDEQRTFTLCVEMNPAGAGGKRTWH